MVVHPFLSHAGVASRLEVIGDPLYHQYQIRPIEIEIARTLLDPLTTLELSDRVHSRLPFLNQRNPLANDDIQQSYIDGSAVALHATNEDLENIRQALNPVNLPSLTDILPWFHAHTQLQKKETDTEIQRIPDLAGISTYGVTMEVRASRKLEHFPQTVKSTFIALGRSYDRPSQYATRENTRTAAMLGYSETTVGLNVALKMHDHAKEIARDIDDSPEN